VLPWESDGDFGPGNDLVCNAWFASRPGHPFFKMAIDDLKANPPVDPGLDPLSTTGPKFLTRIYRRVPAEQWEMFMPARPLLNPRTPRNPRQYRDILKAGVAYGIHHCHGTWREYSMGRRLLHGIKGVVRQFI
jgi:hypothetical protein